MINQLKNMLIGLFVLIASFLIIGIILFIKPSAGDGKQIIKVRFNNINGIKIGTPVTYAGQTIGEVADIIQVVSAREQVVNQYGQVYPYLLTLHLDSHYTIYSTDEIEIQTQGLLGEKYVAIIPKPIRPGQATHVITPNDVVYADAYDLLETTMNEIANLSQKFESTLEQITLWLKKYGDTLGSAIHSADVMIKDIDLAVKKFNNLDIMQDVKNAIANIASVFDQVDDVLTKMRSEDFFGNLDKIAENIAHTTTTIRQGKGTLGKIIEDDGLYLQINALMTKANTLMNDINQYGLLFEYNHQWQRNRIQLMSEANRIKDAKSFQNYMNEQIDL